MTKKKETTKEVFPKLAEIPKLTKGLTEPQRLLWQKAMGKRTGGGKWRSPERSKRLALRLAHRSIYKKIYTLMSEMVWTQKGQKVGPRRLNPVIVRGVTRGDVQGRGSQGRKTIKQLGKMASDIEDINVSTDETDLDKWNRTAKKTLRNLGQTPPNVAIPVADVSSEFKPRKKRKRGTPQAIVHPPRGSEGKQAGREPGTN